MPIPASMSRYFSVDMSRLSFRILKPSTRWERNSLNRASLQAYLRGSESMLTTKGEAYTKSGFLVWIASSSGHLSPLAEVASGAASPVASVSGETPMQEGSAIREHGITNGIVIPHPTRAQRRSWRARLPSPGAVSFPNPGFVRRGCGRRPSHFGGSPGIDAPVP